MNILSETEHVCDLGTVSMKDSSVTRDTKISIENRKKIIIWKFTSMTVL